MNANARAYQFGSAAPAYEPTKIREAKEEYEKKARREVEKNVLRKKAEGKSYSLLQIAVIAFCMAVCVLFAGVYIVGLSRQRALQTETEAAKKKLQDLRKENALLELAVEEQTDYAAVYAFAENIGMHLPDKQQVVYYDRAATEYVEKKAEIPNE